MGRLQCVQRSNLFARIDSPLTRLGEEHRASIQLDAQDGLNMLTVDVQYVQTNVRQG